MRFLTFNLWHGLSPVSPVLFEGLEPAERRRLREQQQLRILREVSPDVGFFQEVNPVVKRGPEIATHLGMDLTFQPDLVGLKLFGLGLPLNLNSGLVTVAARRLQARRIAAVSLSRPGLNLVRPWGSWQLKEERFALFTEVSSDDLGHTLLINTHMHHGLESTAEYLEQLEVLGGTLELSASAMSEMKDRLARGNQRRNQELAVLLRALEKHEKSYDSVVLAGDFNASPASELNQILREMGFRDAWSEACPQDPGLTYDRTRNEANHVLQASFPLTLVVEDLSFSAKVKEALLRLAREHEYRPRRIDYVWFKSNRMLQVASARLVGLPDAEGLAPSDHFGVCTDISKV